MYGATRYAKQADTSGGWSWLAPRGASVLPDRVGEPVHLIQSGHGGVEDELVDP